MMFGRKNKNINPQLNPDATCPVSANLIEQALKNSQSLWWVYDLRSGQCSFCAETAGILGFDPVAINEPGMLKKLMPREDYELMQDNIGVLLRGGSALYETDLRLKDRQGNIRWFCLKGNFIEKTADGIPTKLAGIAFEISGRKNSEANLNFIKDKFDCILKNSSNAILLCECTNSIPERIIEFNEAACKMFNLQPQELSAAQPASILNSGMNENSANNISTKLKQNGRVIYRIEKNGYDKTSKTIEISSQLFETTTNRQILLSVFSEIPRASSDKSMQDSELKYKKLAENLPVIVYRYHVLPEKGFEYINSAAESISGYSPAEYMRDPDIWEKIIHPDDKTKLKKIRVDSHCNCASYKLRWIRKDGQEIWLEHHDTQHFDKDGQLISVEGVCVDISRKIKMEEQVEQSVLAGQMLSRIVAASNQNSGCEKIITECLRELCKFCNAEETALFTIEHDIFIHKYYWNGKSASQTKTLFTRASLKENFPWWHEQLQRGTFRIADSSILPAEGIMESTALMAHNIKRAITIPLNSKSPWAGFVILTGISPCLPEQVCKTIEIAAEIIYSIYVKLISVETITLSKEKYWSITRGIPDIVTRINRNGVYLECDTDIHDDLPLPLDQLIGKKVGDVMPEPLARKTIDSIAAALDTGKTQIFEYEMSIEDNIRHFETRLSFLNKNEVLCLVRNITEQKTAQTEIQNYKDFLDKIFDNMPIGIFTKALPDFRYNMCNKAAAAILNLTQEEILDKTDFDIFNKDVAKLCRMNDIDAILEDQIIDSEEIISDKNGQKKCLRIIKLPIKRNNSKFLLEIAEDITDKKKIMDDLKTSEEKYRSLIEAADDRIALFDLTGNILLANNAFYETAGYEREEKSAVDYFKHIFPAAENPFQNMLDLLMAENMTAIEYKIPHKNGKELNMLAKFLLIKNGENKPYAMMGIIRDITELKNIHQRLIEAKEQAEKSENLKSAFLANMSHEIRTPMSAIVGFANLLAEPGATDQEKLEYINIINQNSSELLDLITDIVDISKLESGQLETHKVRLPIQQVIDQLYDRFSKLTKAEIKLRKKIPGGFENTLVHTDENRFIQIFSNLLSNSLKFTPKGSIEFGFFPPENDFVKFFVKDTGTGIAPEFSNIIFEPFRQADDSYSRKFRGTGLGLSISMNLVKLLGGSIWFESEPGKGTTFFFTLPMPKPDELPESAPAPQTIDWVSENFTWSGKTVLIVDDNEICLRYLEAILQNTGFKLLRAESGIKAVMMCQENPEIDIVLMDIQMPGMNGLEATAEIKKIRANMPVIAQTAHALSNDRQNILSAGCDEYIAKPIKKLDLLKIIASFVPPRSSRGQT